MGKTNYYAIGLKGWVQVRESASPPKKVTTKAIIKAKEAVEVYDYSRNNYITKVTPIKRTLTSIIYKGGNVVLTLPSSKASRRFGRTIRQHECLKLTLAQFNLLQGKKDVKARDDVQEEVEEEVDAE